ncbi:Pc21g14300 [Penicillium rubens Wisconsin 54-1255]|uniref:Pc21g14300 protein n=1 Tax=Penicillium rubens (strain ATCC 28089 / DSM 1075 / NRRL 1951 / Wisconsin 54-1255) TaxID=500485 RepID=B6HHQ2_PENRW|nr:Pc21g14300 [Penicillium rubens Wisconsin 54-1255]
MSSRFPPSSGFNSRDRSPHRFGDRRPPVGPRGPDDGPAPFGRDPPRGPRALVDSPRGGHFGGRGRGYGRGDFRDRDRDPRDRDRDRDFRDNRDGPPFRRDMDRDWVRRDRDFDPRDNRIGFGRGRSRSPTRDFRDIREPPGRDFDLVRMRRNSRDSIISASSGGPEGPPPSGGHMHRGGMRGRGRGDWEGGRGRGRPPFLDDRDLFRRRSRSREPWRGRDRMVDRDRDRDMDRDRALDRDRMMDRDRDRDLPRPRDRDRELDRDLDRRDRFDRREDWDNRRPDREDRDRPVDFWKRDRPPSRADSRAASGSTTSSHPPTAPGPGAGPALADRLSDHPQVDHARKPSIIPSTAVQEPTRDSERSDPVAVRPSGTRPDAVRPDVVRPDPARPDAVRPHAPRLDAPRLDAARPDAVRPDARPDAPRLDAVRPDAIKNAGPIIRNSPPPAAPQVPAFGSVTAPITNVSPSKDTSDQPTARNSTFPTEGDRHGVLQRQPAQPPTGPKAERTEITQPLEPRSRPDGPREAGKQQIAPHRLSKPSIHFPDVSPPTAPAAMTRPDSGVGPNEGFGGGRSNSLTSSPTFARIPPPAPRALSREPSMSPRMQPSGIPTGPRALQWKASSPRGRKGSKQWVRPGYGRTPSIPNALPKQEPVDEGEDASPADETTQPFLPHETDEPESGEILPHEPVREPSPASPSLNLPPRRSLSAVDVQTSDVNELSEQGGTDKPALIPDFEGSSDEEDGENIVFTQEYLDERKRIFEKDMESLRAELPPSPLEDPAIVTLLLKIQLLGMVANEHTVEPSPEPLAERVLERPVDPLPSVEDEEPADHPATERVVSFASTRPEREPEPISETIIPPVVPPGEVTVQNLPFLHSGPPTPISDMDVYHENIATQNRLRDTFSTELSKVQAEVFRKNALLRDEYVSHYKLWRMAIWELDRMKEKKSVTPGPASPPVSTVATTPAPMPEGREGRRYKGNSELDFLNALKASEISAQEELERRRIKMATARPDLGREAVIPNMLEPREAKARIYKDVNNTIECNRALDVFGFVPPPNDFTPEEHVIFTDAFMAHPKRWGKIAESLPGRNFQQCIVHYYLTKEEIKYKAKLNKRWSKRGKGTRKGPRPKSNALIADLGVVKPDFVGEDEPPAVTDTGRPRRAAAPTFGDSTTEAESAPLGRRGQLGKDGETVERPSTRRGGRGGGTRGGRRVKTTTQPDPKAQAIVPQGNLPPVVPPAPLHPGGEMELVSDHVLEGYEARERERSEKESVPPIPRGRVGRGRAKEGVYVFESTEVEPPLATKQLETGYGPLQPTSYWSVPEQRDFPALLGHFGRDFEGISAWMKTKTTVMVKNFYQRRLDSGQKDFELILTDAEEKKARGEATGPLPIPSVAPKRRYEATPSSIIPRPLAPHGDPMAEADEIRFPKGKPVGLSPQPMSLHGRPPSDKDRNVGRYQPLAQASAASPVPSTATLIEESTRAIRAQGGPSHRIQGPRLGYFTEDRRDSSVLPHATSRAQELPISSRHPGSMPQDMARMEPLSAQAYMPAQQPASLLSSTHSRHASLTQPPGSPTQQLRPELDISSVHRDPFAQRPYYSLAGQPMGLAQSPRPGLSPVKDVPRPSATPAPDATRQVPAKRSNIMSILNDEPEEPQPRKRFASEQAPSAPGVTTGINPRPAYQASGPSRHEDSIMSGMPQKPSGYTQQSQYQPPSRGYSEYPGYGGSTTSANNDWMARFDPRAQQTPPQPPAQSLPPQQQQQQSGRQGSYSSYAAPPSQSSLTNLPAPSPAPTPPPTNASQRSAYPNVFSQGSSAQPPMASGSRDMTSQLASYRPGSPGPRTSMPYASRQDPPTPAQSSASLGSHQPQSHRSTPVNLAGASSQYGHNTPPPQSQAGRSMASLASLGRSYTPPSALHPSMSGGTMGSYAPPQSSAPGSIPPLHQRPPGSLGDSVSTPTHHRVYSHGSAQGGLPPPSQPPR